MFTITIDHDRCKRDGLCASVCPVNIFVQREKLTIPELMGKELCVACGQCVAICPQSAISHSEFPADKIFPIRFEKMPTTEQLLELLKSRRAIRAFQDRPLEKEIIEKIIDGARFAPSAHNTQSTEYLVVQDKAVLSQVSAIAVEYLRFETKRLASPFTKAFLSLVNRELAESGLKEIAFLKRVIRWSESGADPILKGAQVLLAFHARRAVFSPEVNAQLALQNASLVAHSLGVGHFYAGLALSPCRAPMARAWNRRIPCLLGIPAENDLYAALALGYPVPRFRNMIERRPARVTWV